MLCNGHAVIQCSVQVYCSSPFIFSFDFPFLDHFYPVGAGIPEEATAGAGRQVCVGGESVHHRGQLQLLRRGGLSHWSQGTGKSPRLFEQSGQHHSHLWTHTLKACIPFPLGAAVSTCLFDLISHLCWKAHSRSEVFQLPAAAPLTLY